MAMVAIVHALTRGSVVCPAATIYHRAGCCTACKLKTPVDYCLLLNFGSLYHVLVHCLPDIKRSPKHASQVSETIPLP